MQIPQNLIDLIDSGLAFTLTVKQADGSALSYTQRAKKAYIDPKTVTVPGEIEGAFKRFDSMHESERKEQGVWHHPCGMVVGVKSRFVRTFNANAYKREVKTAYMGNGKSGRCFVIPRPATAIPDNPPLPPAEDMAERLARQDPPFWHFPPPPHPSEAQHDTQHAHGCPIALPALAVASDPGPTPEGSSD
jgi:hypothetical protein